MSNNQVVPTADHWSQNHCDHHHQLMSIMEVPSRPGGLQAYVTWLFWESNEGFCPQHIHLKWLPCRASITPLCPNQPHCSQDVLGTVGKATAACNYSTQTGVLWAQHLTMFFWKWLHMVWVLHVGFGGMYLFFPAFSYPKQHICSCEGRWLPLLSRLLPERLLSMLSVVTIWILHFRRRTDEQSPRAWSHYNEKGAGITASLPAQLTSHWFISLHDLHMAAVQVRAHVLLEFYTSFRGLYSSFTSRLSLSSQHHFQEWDALIVLHGDLDVVFW